MSTLNEKVKNSDTHKLKIVLMICVVEILYVIFIKWNQRDSPNYKYSERLMCWDRLGTRNYRQGLVNHTEVAHSSKELMSFTYKKKYLEYIVEDQTFLSVPLWMAWSNKGKLSSSYVRSYKISGPCTWSTDYTNWWKHSI